MTAVQPFTIHVPDEVLADLRERLARTRWPGEIPGAAWDYGSNLAYVKELVDYWRTQFDWRAQEAALNRFAHFRTTLDGMGIHFIHERGKGPNPLPLIITHGWPSTVFEMSKIIPLLTDPASHGGDAADAFDVVAPSMPGYGFSDHTTQARHQHRPDCGPLGAVDDRCVRLPALRRPGRRLGRGGDGPPGFCLPRSGHRHAHDLCVRSAHRLAGGHA